MYLRLLDDLNSSDGPVLLGAFALDVVRELGVPVLFSLSTSIKIHTPSISKSSPQPIYQEESWEKYALSRVKHILQRNVARPSLGDVRSHATTEVKFAPCMFG